MLFLVRDTLAVKHRSSNFSQYGLEHSESHLNFHNMHDIHKPAEKQCWDIMENTASLQTGNYAILV
jgi:hypothetical protein